MFEKIGNAWVRRLKGLRCRQKGLLGTVILRLRIVPLKDTAQKHVANTSFDSIWHSPQRTTRGKTLLFFVTHPEPQMSSSLNLKIGQEVPKTLISSPLGH